MPSRWVCLAILLYWAFAATGLFTRDLLPDLVTSSPPDLRSLAGPDAPASRSKWAIMVADDPAYQNLRTVGEARTATVRQPDGSHNLKSRVRFDSGDLLKNTKFALDRNDRLHIDMDCAVDPTGNLKDFQVSVRLVDDGDPLMRVVGTVKGDVLEVETKGIEGIPMLAGTKRFPYQSKEMVQNALGPIDRLPGLQVGQRWKTRVVSPLGGQVQEVTVEVPRTSVIHWDKNLVTTFEVIHHLGTASPRTWVRRDGLVLRQEIPFPLVRLIVERQPDRPGELDDMVEGRRR